MLDVQGTLTFSHAGQARGPTLHVTRVTNIQQTYLQSGYLIVAILQLSKTALTTGLKIQCNDQTYGTPLGRCSEIRNDSKTPGDDLHNGGSVLWK